MQRQVPWQWIRLSRGHLTSVYGGFWEIFLIACSRCAYLEIWSIISSWRCIW